MIVRLHDAKRIQFGGDVAFLVEGHVDIISDERYTESMIISQDSDRLDVQWTNKKEG